VFCLLSGQGANVNKLLRTDLRRAAALVNTGTRPAPTRATLPTSNHPHSHRRFSSPHFSTSHSITSEPLRSATFSPLQWSGTAACESGAVVVGGYGLADILEGTEIGEMGSFTVE